MKTLFDTDVRYAKAVVSGVVWKLEGGKRCWKPDGSSTWYCDGDDLNLFQQWINRGAVMEVSSAMYH